MNQNSRAPSVSLTIDYELTGYSSKPQDQNFEQVTSDILEWLDSKNLKATFFCVGSTLQLYPNLIKSIAEHGHEIGCHGWDHRPLAQLGPKQFAEDLSRFLELAQQLGLPPIRGYRAPFFSLTKDTAWAFDILKDAGFVYDSSIVSAKTILYGFAEMPRHIHTMDNGLIEIPVTIVKPAFGFGIPIFGGTYLRLLPGFMTKLLMRRGLKSTRSGDAVVLYVHPYDLDYTVSEVKAFEKNRFFNWLLTLGRRGMKRKLTNLIEGVETITMVGLADRAQMQK